MVGLLILLQLKLLYNFHISSRVIIRDAMSYQRNENEETKRPYHDSSGISSRPSCHVKNGMASSNLKKPFRVLFTDIWFPVAYSKWRLEEIFSFMQIFHTDILVDRSKLIRKASRINVNGYILHLLYYFAISSVVIISCKFNTYFCICFLLSLQR